jgi:hypothetical protein
MIITELINIFSELPDKFKNDFESDNFLTCWYGSAGLDTKIFDFFCKKNSLKITLSNSILDKKPIRVYFFTDFNYTFYEGNNFSYLNQDFNFKNGIKSLFQYEDLIRKGECIKSLKFANQYCSKLVNFEIEGAIVYCFFISIKDKIFENVLINHNIKIDLACHAGGMAGEGPSSLKELGIELFLGNYNGEIENKFNIETLKVNIKWGLVGSLGNINCSLYKILNE